ncbi:MAG: AAA family ATPase [Methanomassiliicoccales archaeon]|nr:AAA family ATPase [Methanomassiliicoccales archaeon]
MRITISGPPGSGKTTICKMLSDRLGIECVISGAIFREMAEEQGLSLSKFGSLCEVDFKYDRLLDERMLRIAEAKRDVLLEGRLTAHMLHRNGIPAYKIFLGASLAVRAKRIAGREGIDENEARRSIIEREKCEAKRYEGCYGIDLADKSVYDLVIDTSDLTPEQVSDMIVANLEASDCLRRS